MFHEVRVYSPKGNLKKVISAQELSKSYWVKFNQTQSSKLESLILLREYKKQINIADHHASNGTQG